MSEKTAAVLIIGNEILSGRTKDINLPHIATQLGAKGINVKEARVIPDIKEEIIAAVNLLRQKFDYVFTTGGIGPTHDDITAESISEAFGVSCEQNSEAYKILAHHYEKLNVELNAARLRMTMMPQGATLITNPISAAPGFIIENVHVMAGVPKIMQAMLEEVIPSLIGGAITYNKTVLCSLPEGEVAKALGTIQDQFPSIDIGSYPAYATNNFRVSVVLRSTDQKELQNAAEIVCHAIHELNGEAELKET